MKQRPPKERTFLDDPGEYDEFSVLVYRQGLQHRFRLAFHQNRYMYEYTRIYDSRWYAATPADTTSSGYYSTS